MLTLILTLIVLFYVIPAIIKIFPLIWYMFLCSLPVLGVVGLIALRYHFA